MRLPRKNKKRIFLHGFTVRWMRSFGKQCVFDAF